jgi:glycosyltransferase involved in cell wall biosynthesis
MRIYLSGNINGSYRAQNIIKVLGDSNIQFVYAPHLFFNIRFKNRYINRLIWLFLLAAVMPFRFFLILISTHIIILPMNSHIISVFDMILAKILGKKVIVDFYISNYDTLVNDRKLCDRNSFGGKWALFKDKLFLEKADKVIFLNNSESFYYQGVAGVKLEESKISIIPLCIDYKKELFEKELSRENKEEFNVCWWGTYIPLHGLENLIEAFAHIEDESVRLYLFGNSEEKSIPYQKMLEANNLTDRVFLINDHSFANGKLAPFLKENCDLAIGNFGSSEKAKTVLVNKLVDALSLGLPCLTRETKATQELLAQDEGVILTGADPESIAQNILWASKNKAELIKLGNAGKQKYLDTFSPDAFKVKFLSVLEK